MKPENNRCPLVDAAQDNELRNLLQDVAAGDTKSFRQLYDATSAQLYAVALKMLNGPVAADDVLQDAFVQIWHRAGDYHANRGSVRTWMSSIVRYRAIDVLRKQRTDRSFDETRTGVSDDPLEQLAVAADSGSPLGSAIADDDSQFLARCLSRLSAAQRQCVSLAFFRGMTHAELADSQSLPLGTIKSRLRRSLKRLKECLAELGFADEIST